jgi:hypothetical protein
MDALKFTFVNGDTISVAFGVDSTLTIDTPDGVNGVKHGAWGEVAAVEYVKDAGDVVVETVIHDTQPVAEPVTIADTFPPAGEHFTGSSPTETAPNTAVPPIGDVPAVVPDTVEQAVADAQTAVDTALVGDAPDSVSHLAQAQADVAAALAIYPDSVELQDAQTQLAEIPTSPAA